jgi:hypothetical protein
VQFPLASAAQIGYDVEVGAALVLLIVGVEDMVVDTRNIDSLITELQAEGCLAYLSVHRSSKLGTWLAAVIDPAPFSGPLFDPRDGEERLEARGATAEAALGALNHICRTSGP